jgi:superfamily II DNA helicase RecQ
MIKVENIVNKVLKNELSPKKGSNKIKKYLNNLDNQKLRTKGACAYRLCRCLNEIKSSGSSWFDFLSNLRDYIFFFNSVKVSEYIKKNTIEYLSEFSLVIDNKSEIDVVKDYPDWFRGEKYLDQVYNLEKRRKNENVVGDGNLFNLTGYEKYINQEQKVAVRAARDLPGGNTLLISLPTGGGKSLIVHLPTYIEKEKGITIVVMPTVALAMDQEKNAQEHYKNIEDDTYRPQAYYSGISQDKKNLIFKGIKEGTIPILYISPEAILNSNFYYLLLEAAAQDKINRLVIDEAHIVIDWGASFRTEFQFLSIFRKKLLEISNKKIKTVLLSATITDRSTDILKKLFSERDNFFEIRGDALRPEISFVIDKSDNEFERIDKILNILPLLPKPIIIYVISPVDAQKWVELIKEEGFRSVRAFTGETSCNSREKRLKNWNDDNLDIIVATSAFGMGVDKAEIRTVIHCALPESINRFYQEVGRTGRDGFPSLSLLSVVLQKDKDTSFHLIKSSVMTPEKIVSRWNSLKNKAVEQIESDSFWLNADSTPSYLEGDLTGGQSANWNEYVLLFLYRHNLIDLEDIRLDEKTNRHQFLVKLEKINILENDNLLLDYIKPLRKKEWNSIKEEFNKMVNLVKNPYETCWSKLFTNIYLYADSLCQGCPACFKKNYHHFPADNYIDIIGDNFHQEMQRGNEKKLSNEIKRFIGFDKELMIKFNEGNSQEYIYKLIDISYRLIELGIKNIIIPSVSDKIWSIWVRKLSYASNKKYSIFEIDELLKTEDNTRIGGLMATLYSQSQKEINKIYNYTQNYIKNSDFNQVIHIGTENIIIDEKNKMLDQLVDGISVHMDFLYNLEEGEK